MKTFVSHQPQVTIRNCSLMLCVNLAPLGRPTMPFFLQNTLTNGKKWCLLSPVSMKTTFAIKMLKHAPVIGCMANWQRGSRPSGIVGLKF
jgi:hypothetical protein